MKKTTKKAQKLALVRNVVRDLSSTQLDGVAGGIFQARCNVNSATQCLNATANINCTVTCVGATGA